MGSAPMAGVVSRRAFLARAGAVGLGVAVGGPILWRQTAVAASEQAAGIHLGYGGDPARQMAVSWSTSGPVARPVVEIGLDPSYGLTVPADSRTAPDVGTVYHHGIVGALDPGTTYYYRVRHDGADPVTGTFHTAPANAGSFRFATFGDMGVTAGAATNVAQIAAASPAFAFVVGDLCYADLSGGTGAPLPYDPKLWDAWLAQIAPSAATVPWMATVGNHEMERNGGELGYSPYLARFALPGNGVTGGAVTYAIRYRNVALVALDGNDASYEIPRNNGYLGAAQDGWLRTTLAALRADKRVDFIVVGFHNCMYCSNLVHASDGGNRRRWEPLFDEYSVDLVVNGHNHGYERTHGVRSGRVVTDAPSGATIDSALGTTYLTAGGGGQQEYPTSLYPSSYVVEEGGVKVPEVASWSSVRYLAHSIALVDVTPRDRNRVATMKITGRAKSGAVVDTITLRRQRSSGTSSATPILTAVP